MPSPIEVHVRGVDGGWTVNGGLYLLPLIGRGKHAQPLREHTRKLRVVSKEEIKGKQRGDGFWLVGILLALDSVMGRFNSWPGLSSIILISSMAVGVG